MQWAVAVVRIGAAALAFGPAVATLDGNPLRVCGDRVEALDALACGRMTGQGDRYALIGDRAAGLRGADLFLLALPRRGGRGGETGGFGVLGASTFGPEQLARELRWIDEHVTGRPYGVDVLIPTTYDQEGEAAGLGGDFAHLIPEPHRAFMEAILTEAGEPALPADEQARVHREIAEGRGNMTPHGERRLLAVALAHPQVKLVVSALEAPPADVVADLRGRGVMIGALCGKASHALRQLRAGVELIVAQGTEAGGHTGSISTLVLVPEVVEACPDVPVLAAGGITRGSQIAAALALGAKGVWCGTIWLGTRESELTPFEKSVLFETLTEDAVRSRVRTGKPVRMIRSRMSDAWEKPAAPPHLPTPLQGSCTTRSTHG